MSVIRNTNNRFIKRKGNLLFLLITIILMPFFVRLLIPINSKSISANFSNIDEDSFIAPKYSASSTKNWTFMVYLDADCNLEGAGIDDINEMEKEGSDSNINIVVQMDRRPGYDYSNGDWTGAKRYYITKDYDSSTISSTLVQDLGEVNMGASSTLQSFIQWAKSNYPADNYALILWDHGSGIMWGNYLGGVCWDDTNSNDYLTLSEISSVLSANPVDLVGFDACLMGATEVHYQLKDYVDIIVASEDLEPGDGYPYDDILNYLRLNPDATPAELGEQIVIKYNDFYSSPSYSVTQAAVDALDSDFNESLTAFISDLDNALQLEKNDIQDARAASLEFDEESYIDLYDFANEIRVRCSVSVSNSAQQLMYNISNIVIEEAHSASQVGAHGLSIYFPESYSEYSSNYETSAFAQDLQWDEFLIKYHTGSTTGEYDDEFEENDIIADATILSHGTYNNLILNASDLDFYNISLGAGNTIQVDILFDDDEGDLNLGLYNTTGDLVNFSNSTTDNEDLSYTANVDGYYTILVNQYGTEYPYQSYDLIIDDGSDDDFEQNDVWSQAREINNNTLYTNLICKDSDFYKFWATEGYLINFTIIFDYIEGDLDLYLWNNNVPEIITGSYTATDNENLLYFADYTGWYIVEVYNYEDNLNYSLSANVTYIDDGYEINNDINLAAELLGYGDYYDLVCINPDFYNISLTEDTWINITMYFNNDEGDIDLYLIYVYDWSPFEYEFVGFSTSYTDNEYIFYNVEFNGSYYIMVDDYEYNLHYSLSIHETTAIWDDIFENNDWFDEASQLQIGNSYNNLAAIDWDAYYFYAPSGYQITITLDYNVSEGDLDLYLIYYVAFQDIAYILDVSSSYSNQEVISFITTTSDYFYILVYYNEINLNYNLTLSQVAIIGIPVGDDDGGGGGGISETAIISGTPIILIIMIIGTTILYLGKKRRHFTK